MKISIVTVAFNSASTIAETLDSVAAQDHPDIEHIVIDGGSSDATAQIVRERGRRVSAFVSEPDGGIYFGMNKGLALCTGDVVGFLNSDDFFATSRSVSTIAAGFGNAAVDVVHGDLVYVQRDHPESVVRYWKATAFSPGAFSRAWCPAHPTFYARRSVMDRTGGFDTSYRIAADLELMLRVLEVQRSPSRVIPEVLVRMRAGGASNSSLRGVYRQNVEVLRAIRSNGLGVNVPFFTLAKFVRRAEQFVRRGRGGADMIHLRFEGPFTISTEREARRVFGVDGPRLGEGASAHFDGEVTLSSGVEFRGRCIIGAGVIVDSGSVLTDASVDRGCRIRPYSILHDCRIGAEGIIGPFCFVRDGTAVGDRCIVGAHVEVARSALGNDVKVSHQAFIGDAELGDGVIIGAGVVFCNYDNGVRHRSVVGCGTTVGSGTMLVAPVSIGRDAVIGAGSVITRPVSDGQRVIQRRTAG